MPNEFVQLGDTAPGEAAENVRLGPGSNSVGTVGVDAGVNNVGRVDVENDESGVTDPTGAKAGIDYAHHEVHEGSSFSVCVSDMDLDTAQSLILAFKTPDSARLLHVVPDIQGSGQLTFSILRGPTITADSGTAELVFNRNDDLQTASQIIDSIASVAVSGRARLTPTITDDGTAICTIVLGAGKKVGGETRGTREWVLKRNTVYAFRCQSAGDNNIVQMGVNWYEKTMS